MSKQRSKLRKHLRKLRPVFLSVIGITLAVPFFVITANAAPTSTGTLHNWLSNHPTLILISRAVVCAFGIGVCWVAMAFIDAVFDK